MKKAKMMKKYAALIAEIGVNANPKQDVIIEAPVEMYKFVRYLVMELYTYKAKSVEVDYSDSIVTKQQLMHQSITKLSNVPEWQIQKTKYRVDNNYQRIVLVGDDPDVYKNVNHDKIKVRTKTLVEKFQPFKKKYHNNELAWCIAAVPTLSWAKKVFPDLSPTQGVNKLWEYVYSACRINEDDDPVISWEKHILELQKHAEILNKYNFAKLHYTNSLGTDLYVGLVKKHVWVSARVNQGFNGEPFVPNIPTEEVFTMPDKNNVNGVVYASKPLSNGGVLINDFYFKFKNGKVIEYNAKKGLDQLKYILEYDEGSSRLGEVALVPYSSPISLQNIIYQETLYDENASCHLALGQSFGENIQNGLSYSEEDLSKLGANQSKMHVDFMIGTKDLQITGIKEDGSEVVVFKDGNFAF